MTVRRELSSEYRRRLDALEAEWATRASTRATELEAAHALKLQQVCSPEQKPCKSAWRVCMVLQASAHLDWMCSVHMQVELSGRLERERLEASLTEAAAAKQRLADQLASAQQVSM